jgi:hypothetical protein
VTKRCVGMSLGRTVGGEIIASYASSTKALFTLTTWHARRSLLMQLHGAAGCRSYS